MSKVLEIACLRALNRLAEVYELWVVFQNFHDFVVFFLSEELLAFFESLICIFLDVSQNVGELKRAHVYIVFIGGKTVAGLAFLERRDADGARSRFECEHLLVCVLFDRGLQFLGKFIQTGLAIPRFQLVDVVDAVCFRENLL